METKPEPGSGMIIPDLILRTLYQFFGLKMLKLTLIQAFFNLDHELFQLSTRSPTEIRFFLPFLPPGYGGIYRGKSIRIHAN
jgi:hypothetical protein